MTKQELEWIMLRKSLIPRLIENKITKIREDCFLVTTPFLDSHNDYIEIYITYIDDKLVLADENTIPDILSYSSAKVASEVQAYINKKFPKKCSYSKKGLVFYELNSALDVNTFGDELEFAFHDFLGLILGVIGLSKYLAIYY